MTVTFPKVGVYGERVGNRWMLHIQVGNVWFVRTNGKDDDSPRLYENRNACEVAASVCAKAMGCNWAVED